MIGFTKFIANFIAVRDLVPMSDIYHPANIPTRYWLTPSGVRMPTSEKTSDIRSGLREIGAPSQEPPLTERTAIAVHSPSIVNPGVLCYLLLTHALFRARR